MSFFKGFIRLWDIQDNRPRGTVDFIICMALSPRRGELGEMMRNCIDMASLLSFDRLIFCNRWRIGIDTVAQAQKNYALKLGVPEHKIFIPPTVDETLRNTYTEAQWAIQNARSLPFQGRNKTLCFITEKTHMRLTLLIFIKIIRHITNIDLYWISVDCDKNYGTGYDQMRFRFPIFFFVYQRLVTLYAKMVDWV